MHNAIQIVAPLDSLENNMKEILHLFNPHTRFPQNVFHQLAKFLATQFTDMKGCM